MQRFFLKVFILSVFLFPAFVYGQTMEFGNISFAITPKVMKDGSITDISLGINYNDILGGDYRYRGTSISKNEELFGFTDSLNAISEKTYEFFILPVGYQKKSNGNLFWAGVGAYYEYNNLKEKGFFDAPEFEEEGFQRINIYENEFSMHVVGPLIDLKFIYNHDYFNINFFGGVVPVFFLAANEEFGIRPFLGNKKAENSQTKWGSPYFYAGLDAIIYKYFNLGFQYTFSKLTYELIDYNFDYSENVIWSYPETTVIGHTLQLEASILVPLGEEVRFQIGYGYNTSIMLLDSRELKDSKHYLILGAKKQAK